MSEAGAASLDEAVAAAAVGVTGIKRRGPLHLAAANGKVEVCKFLISSCEVDVDATDADGKIRYYCCSHLRCIGSGALCCSIVHLCEVLGLCSRVCCGGEGPKFVVYQLAGLAIGSC
jgi:hypothetical protein